MQFMDANQLRAALSAALKNLEAQKELVNALNVFPVPDGDTGTNMFLTLQSACCYGMEEISDHCGKVAMAASKGALMGARGNSGVILSQIFRGFAKGIEDCRTIGRDDMIRAMDLAAKISYKAVMKPTEGTILTVIRKMAEYATSRGYQHKEPLELLRTLLEVGNLALEETPKLLPVLAEAGVVDSGGKGLMVIAEGWFQGLTGEISALPSSVLCSSSDRTETASRKQYSYRASFILHSQTLSDSEFRKLLEGKGMPIVCVQVEKQLKVECLTDHPGEVLELAISYGPLTNFALENIKMEDRNVEMGNVSTSALPSVPSRMVEEVCKVGFIPVAVGEGIVHLFRDLKADYIVVGGQTMNPSVEDFLKAIDEVQAETIYLLPNNSNIILTANNAADMSDKCVRVIPTKTIPQGIAAILNFDEDDPHPEKAVMQAIEEVQSASITYAVRDTSMDGREIHKDDVMAILDGEIVANGKDRKEVLRACLDQAIHEDTGIVTCFAGEDISEAEMREDESYLKDVYPEIVVEMIRGEQPVYSYLISIE